MGNIQYTNELYEQHVNMLKEISRKFYKTKLMEYEDIYQTACLYMQKAVDSYREETGTPFRVYASKVINNELCHLITKLNRASKRNGIHYGLESYSGHIPAPANRDLEIEEEINALSGIHKKLFSFAVQYIEENTQLTVYSVRKAMLEYGKTFASKRATTRAIQELAQWYRTVDREIITA